MGVTYNHEKVNFRLFNAYKRYKVLIKVKDEDSAITVSGLSGCYQLNSILFLNTKSISVFYLYKSYIFVSVLFQKRKKDPHESCETFYKENAYTCANYVQST